MKDRHQTPSLAKRKRSCSIKTHYRLFEKESSVNIKLPMKEKRGKQAFRRAIKKRDREHPNFKNNEFGHLEGDRWQHHKSAIITLVERLTRRDI